jgi:hypothetical protein
MKSGARLLEVTSDDVGGEVFIWAVIDDREIRGIVYEGMFYCQLRADAAGLTVTSVTEIAPIEAKRSTRPQIMKFVEDCDADDEFLWDTYRKGYHLFVHRTADGGEYIVMATKCVWGEPRPYNGGLAASDNQMKRRDSR